MASQSVEEGEKEREGERERGRERLENEGI